MQDDSAMQEEAVDTMNDDDEGMDQTPAFLSPDEAVEVVAVDEDAPMEDDDDTQGMNGTTTPKVTTPDMSRVQLRSHSSSVYAVATTLDTSSLTPVLTILSGGGDDQAFVHSIAATNPLESPPSSTRLVHAHTDSVSCVAWNTPYLSPDRTKTPHLAAVGAYDGAICLYDMNHSAGSTTSPPPLLYTLEGPTDVEWLSFHPKGGTVLLVGSAADGTVWMYHLPTQKCLQVFVGHQSAVTCGSFTPDGRWALSGSSDGTLRIWAPKTGNNKHVFSFNNNPSNDQEAAPAGLTCLDTAGELVVVGAEDGQAHVCHVGTKKVVASLRHFEKPLQQTTQQEEETEWPSSVEAVAFCPALSSWCATGGVDGVLKIWDLANQGQCRQTCRVTGQESGGITRLQWHVTLPLVFCVYTTGALRLWDARNGHLLHTVTAGTAAAATTTDSNGEDSNETINDLSVEFLDPEGKEAIAVTASDDGVVRLFDVSVAALLEQQQQQQVAAS